MNLGFFVIEIAYKVNFTIARVEYMLRVHKKGNVTRNN